MPIQHQSVLFIYTHRSPFGQVPEFVENELPYWRDFTHVYVISLAEGRGQQAALAPNCTAISVCPIRNSFGRIKYVLDGLRHVNLLAEMARILSSPKHFISRLLSLCIEAQAISRYISGTRSLIQSSSLTNTCIVFYSYWLGAATEAAIQCRTKRPTKSLVISRAHGSDVYENKVNGGYLPNRARIIRRADHIFPISKHGATFLKAYYKCPASKITCSPLGTPFQGPFQTTKREPRFHIVSIAYATSIKQLDLIRDALAQIEHHSILWTHIGGGPTLKGIAESTQDWPKIRPWITVNLLGSIPSTEVISTLKSIKPNLLLNTSKSEGIPVSMMEAASLGIPLLGPPVGGVPEIICDGLNGALLKNEFCAMDIANSIIRFINMPDVDYESQCRNSYSQWHDRFNIKSNYTTFTSIVKSLSVRHLHKA
jgi:colanic acid/amylovoran biosynthesis glycosyltransferase